MQKFDTLYKLLADTPITVEIINPIGANEYAISLFTFSNAFEQVFAVQGYIKALTFANGVKAATNCLRLKK